MSHSVSDSTPVYRNHVSTLVQVIAANPNADEAAIVDLMRSVGYTELDAELLVAFVPLGLARSVIKRLSTAFPVMLSDHVLVLWGDRSLEVPLMLVPEFVAAVHLGEEALTSGIIRKEDFTSAALLSVELSLINQALNAGTTLSSIAAPVLLRLGEASGFGEWYERTVKTNEAK